METKNEIKQLIKEQKEIVQQILQLQKKEDDIIIKIRRLKKKMKNIGTPWRANFEDGQ